MKQQLFRIAVIIPLLFGMVGTIHAQTSSPATGIRVLVYGIHYAGNLVYNYKVINNGDTPFNNFTIGSKFDSAEDDELPQLVRLPLGWKYGEQGEVGTEIIIPPASTKQPQNWQPSVFGQQGISRFYFEWLTPWDENDESNIIKPGQTLSGFSVTVPLEGRTIAMPTVKGQPLYTGPDEMYVKGGFKVGFGSAKKFQEVWGTLEREDTTPPVLTVTLTPSTMPANSRMVPISATITVKDDYDPAPTVQLEAIMSNEVVDKDDVRGAEPGTDDRQFQLKAAHTEGNHAGRIYTVVYSATDGTGNKTTASATITVQHQANGHDDRKDEKDKKDRDDHKRDR
jgi:hypothetical protein